jgi:6-phosphofructokinase 2
VAQTIATLTVNPAIDVSTSIEHMEPFHKLRCRKAQRDAGGGGINVSRVLKRFGVDTRAIYPAGGFTGDLLHQLVSEQGVESAVIRIKGETREDFTVVDRNSGEQFRFVLPGPALETEETLRLLETVRTLSPRPDFLIASGSLPPRAPTDFFAHVAAIAASRGMRLVLDTSGQALADALSQPVFLLKVNLREFQALVGRKVTNLPQWVSAGRELLRTRNIAMLAVSLGEEGALLITQDTAWFGTAPAIKPVSTVGAGDSFLGALMWRLTLGCDLGDALHYAIAAGSAALLAPGTELCRMADIDLLLPLVSVRAEQDALQQV